jgi:hypothetical protein
LEIRKFILLATHLQEGKANLVLNFPLDGSSDKNGYNCSKKIRESQLKWWQLATPSQTLLMIKISLRGILLVVRIGTTY